MKPVAILAAMLAAAVIAPAQSTTKLQASKANEYGIIYSLPNTVLDIVIETEHTLREPGEFYNYANRNLNISNAIKTPSRSVAVKSVTIVPRGVANPESRWMMQFKGGVGTWVLLNDAYLPVAINTDDVAPAKAITIPEAKAAAPTPLETPAASQAITQEMAMSTSTSKRAQLAAERVFELRENRNDLISGQAENTPPDGRSMQLALDNLAAQEAALTAMFAGTEKKWTQVSTVTFVPDSTNVSNAIVARISATDGVVGTDDLSGAPLYLTLKITDKGTIPTDEKGNHKPFPKNGVAYQIPGTAEVTINYDGREVAKERVNLAQLGITYGLDPKLFTDKNAPAYLLLDPTTGAIITLGTKF